MRDVLRGLSPARIFARPTAETAWLGPAQRSALSYLTSTRPCKILRGPPASGRSLLLSRLGRELGPRARVIGISGSKLRGGSVLATVLDAAGVAHETPRAAACRHLLDALVAEWRTAGDRVVIAIDDAEALEAAALPELERLSALALAGHPGPGVELALSAASVDGSTPAAILRERAGERAVHALRWLDAEEVEAYIAWRLERFGLAGLFTRTAMQLVARCTQGRFRAIDVLSQMALLLMRRHEARRVGVTLVGEAAAALARRRQAAVLERRALPRPQAEPPRPAAAFEARHDPTAAAPGATQPRARAHLRLVK